MSPLGDLARQDDYELPDIGPPLIPGGPQFSPGLSAVNQAMGSLLAPRPRDPQSPVAYRTASPLVNITEQDIADATEAAMASSGGGLGIKAYHSSPHDFERFDLSKIGTGEGAQAYGHGLYFAESPAVSGQGGQYWQQFADRFREGPEGVATQTLKQHGLDRKAAADALDNEIAWHQFNIKEGTVPRSVEANKQIHDKLVQARDLLASDKPVGPRTYEVDIKADPAHFLDWDKRLSRQSGKVDEALKTILKDQERLPADWIKSSPGAEGRLSEAGIPGIKYLDQGSRMHASDIANAEKTIESLKARGQTHMLDAWQEELARLKKAGASSNYVVFNPAIIDIMRKYGIAGAAPLGMGALAAQDSYDGQ